MKILVTGNAGFIGAHMSKLLNDQGHKVYGLDSLDDYYDVNLKKKRLTYLNNNNVKNLISSINKPKIFNEIYDEFKFEYVIHLAAQAGVRNSLENPTKYLSSNIDGTLNLLEFLRHNKKIKHLLCASTSSVYGFNSKKSFTENDNTDHQLSIYASTKKAMESLIHSYSYNFDIPSTIFRFFTVYGPWGRPDMALFKFVQAIENYKFIDVYNNGEMWRDFTYIDDLVKSIFLLIKVFPSNSKKIPNDSLSPVSAFRIVNIGCQKPINLMNFIHTISEILNKKAKINFLPMQPGDISYTKSNSNLLKKLTNYTPDTPTKKGIINFIKWYKDYYKECIYD